MVWNDRCHANLAVYLKRPEIGALGRPAMVVKGCDQRTLVVLEKESQFDRSAIYVIGMACAGMNRPKCSTCDVHQPRRGRRRYRPGGESRHGHSRARYAAINAFLRGPLRSGWPTGGRSWPVA